MQFENSYKKSFSENVYFENKDLSLFNKIKLYLKINFYECLKGAGNRTLPKSWFSVPKTHYISENFNKSKLYITCTCRNFTQNVIISRESHIS